MFWRERTLHPYRDRGDVCWRQENTRCTSINISAFPLTHPGGCLISRAADCLIDILYLFLNCGYLTVVRQSFLLPVGGAGEALLHLECSPFTPRTLLMFFFSTDGHICLHLSYPRSKRKSLIHTHFASVWESRFCLFLKALSFNKWPFVTIFFCVVVCLFPRSCQVPVACFQKPFHICCDPFSVHTPAARRWIGPILVQMFTPEEPTLLCEGGSFKT